MKTKINAAAGLLAFLASVSVSLGAWAPVGVGFINDAKTGSKEAGFPARDDSVYGFRLGFYCAANAKMYGLSVSTLGNGLFGQGSAFSDGDIAGIQVAGLFNDAASAKYGAWQIAGLWNELRNESTAVQIAGFANVSSGNSLTGAQFAGVFNQVKDLRGLQIAGVVNLADDVSGVQIAGLANVVDHDMSGLQIGAINNVQGTLSGIQIGVINYAKWAGGVQIGAINVVGSDFSGVQLGAFNTWETADAYTIPFLRIFF